MGKNKSSDSESSDSSSGSGGIVLLGLVALIAVALLGYLFKDNILALFGKTDVAPAAKKGAVASTTDLDADGKPINAGGYLINADGSLKTDSSGEPILGSGVSGPVPSVVNLTNTFTAALDKVKAAVANGAKEAESASDPANYFPLKQASGSALHTPNPYVKDLQQYLNKFGGASLDLDGAFGSETEAAAIKTLGNPTITREQYNSIIAPPLGKPQV